MESQVRNCQEMGKKLIDIFRKLTTDQQLIKLLYYTDKDPYNKENLTDKQIREEVYEKLIKVTPRVGAQEVSHPIVTGLITDSHKIKSNGEFATISLEIEVFVPLTQWIIKDTNLRVFAIIGRIQDNLRGITVDGLGKITGGDFELEFITDEICAYKIYFEFENYD